MVRSSPTRLQRLAELVKGLSLQNDTRPPAAVLGRINIHSGTVSKTVSGTVILEFQTPFLKQFLGRCRRPMTPLSPVGRVEKERDAARKDR
jgi:hypothetical protein